MPDDDERLERQLAFMRDDAFLADEGNSSATENLAAELGLSLEEVEALLLKAPLTDTVPKLPVTSSDVSMALFSQPIRVRDELSSKKWERPSPNERIMAAVMFIGAVFPMLPLEIQAYLQTDAGMMAAIGGVLALIKSKDKKE